MHDVCLIHYSEIALKGANRGWFEDALAKNIKTALPANFKNNFSKRYGRLVLSGPFEAADTDKVSAVLSKIFGIANFCFARRVPLDISAIKSAAIELVGSAAGKTFKLETTRPNKQFSKTSLEINNEVGREAAASTGKKVDVKNPDITCFITVSEKECYLFLKKYNGPGGLPVGTSGRAVVLLSGGIDSPVAAWKMLRRGMKLDFIHFHSYPYTNKASIEKVKELAAALKEWSGGELILVSFIDIQKMIMTTAPAKYRVLMYRRLMLKIAEQIAVKRGSQAIVTGENLGQVASQTIENMTSVGKAVTLPILRPLVGENKEDIIREAKRIGTYNISIRPHEDCCTLFVPKNPATKSWSEELEREEAKMSVEELIKNAIEKIEFSSTNF